MGSCLGFHTGMDDTRCNFTVRNWNNENLQAQYTHFYRLSYTIHNGSYFLTQPFLEQGLGLTSVPSPEHRGADSGARSNDQSRSEQG